MSANIDPELATAAAGFPGLAASDLAARHRLVDGNHALEGGAR